VNDDDDDDNDHFDNSLSKEHMSSVRGGLYRRQGISSYETSQPLSFGISELQSPEPSGDSTNSRTTTVSSLSVHTSKDSADSSVKASLQNIINWTLEKSDSVLNQSEVEDLSRLPHFKPMATDESKFKPLYVFKSASWSEDRSNVFSLVEHQIILRKVFYKNIAFDPFAADLKKKVSNLS